MRRIFSFSPGLTALAVLLGCLAATPARALDYYSTADISGSYVSMTAVMSLDYYSDCTFEYLCEAFVEGQEYVNGGYVAYSSGDSGTDNGSDITAEAVLYDLAVLGNTYTMEGFYYAFNDYIEEWYYFGYNSASTTAQAPPSPPVIAGISPSTGVAGQSGYIAIYGWNLSGGSVSVSMDGASPQVIYVSDGQVNVYYSNVVAGTHYLSVWTSDGGWSTNSAPFTAVAADPSPAVTSYSPTAFSYTSSNPLTISGSGFGTSPDVYVSYPDGSGEWAAVSNAADTLIYATAYHLSSVAGTVAITVYSNGYWGQGFIGNNPSSTTVYASVSVPPVVTGLSDNGTDFPGTSGTLTLTGTNLAGNTTAWFDFGPATVTSFAQNSATIIYSIPANVSIGFHTLYVATLYGNWTGLLFQVKPTPVLLCAPQTVTRGGNVNCSVSNAIAGAVSSWSFSNGTVVVPGPIHLTTWSGVMVTSGTVSAAIAGYGNLTANITVNARQNWNTQPVAPQQVPDGTLPWQFPAGTWNAGNLPSPPAVGAPLGTSQAGLIFDYSFSTLPSGPNSGPNAGFSYVTSVTYPPAVFNFKYEIAIDVSNAASTFAKNQCGIYPANAYISYANLSAQVTRHEAGQLGQSHWFEYSTSLSNADNNFGLYLESAVANPGDANFGNTLTRRVQQQTGQVGADTGVEPFDVTHDINGLPLGEINYAPYTDNVCH